MVCYLQRYTLRLLPLGGFVSFPRYINSTLLKEQGIELQGDVAEDAKIAQDDPNLLENRPAPHQALIIGAGVAANAVLSWSCFFTSASVIGIPSIIEQQVGGALGAEPGIAAATA